MTSCKIAIPMRIKAYISLVVLKLVALFTYPPNKGPVIPPRAYDELKTPLTMSYTSSGLKFLSLCASRQYSSSE